MGFDRGTVLNFLFMQLYMQCLFVLVKFTKSMRGEQYEAAC